MISMDSIESAYCFIHQKWRVYKFSTIDWQKDDIEYAIAQYVEGMDRQLYTDIANGKQDFLTDHRTFAKDMQEAEERLEKFLNVNQ